MQDKCHSRIDTELEAAQPALVSPEHVQDSFSGSFDGPQDPFDPRNMTPVRKWILLAIVCSGILCVTCASSIYTAAYAQLRSEFGVSSTLVTLGLSSFVLGIGWGPLITSPLSEHYGRRPIYLVSWTMFLLFTIPSTIGKDIQSLIVTRFFAGCAGGTYLSVAGGTVGDLFAPENIQLPMIFASLAPFVGPLLGPVIGGFINYHIHWRVSFYFILIWAAILLALIITLVPETYHPVKLRQKAQYIRQTTGNANYAAHIEGSAMSKRTLVARSLLRPFQLLFLEPMCTCLNLHSATTLGILYLFFGVIPLVFRTTYGMNLWQTGLVFLGQISGMLIAAASISLWAFWQSPKPDLGGKVIVRRAEHRLYLVIIGTTMIPVGLLVFAWTISADIHWIAPITGSSMFGAGALYAFTGTFTFLVETYPLYAASALASNGVTRCSFSAAFPLFGIAMYEKLGYPWATTLLALLTASMLPFPWLFLKYGKVLRERSRFTSNP